MFLADASGLVVSSSDVINYSSGLDPAALVWIYPNHLHANVTGVIEHFLLLFGPLEQLVLTEINLLRLACCSI